MIATITIDPDGTCHYRGARVAIVHETGGWEFISAAEMASWLVEALDIWDRAERRVRRQFRELWSALYGTAPNHAKSERIRATAPRAPRGLTKSEAAHVHQGQMWAVPLDQAKALARAHRERLGKGA